MTRSARIMSKEDAALRLHCLITDICKLMANGDLPLIKIDGLWYTTKIGVDEYERSINMSENNVPWIGTEILDKAKTEAFMNRKMRSDGRPFVPLATELKKVNTGESVRLTFRNKKQALSVQNIARDASEMAGWYSGIRKQEWSDWLMFRTSISEDADGNTVLTITRLNEGKRTAEANRRIREAMEKRDSHTLQQA